MPLIPILPLEEVPELDELGKVHFVGIGGSGMNSVASVPMELGLEVSGSDRQDSKYLQALAAKGARVHVGHRAEQVADADTVVTTQAIRETNPELVAARERGLLLLPRAAALASVIAGRDAVAVAGTHGKTTTTSMLTVALQHCGADPSFAIGGSLSATGANAHDGSGTLFVAEADESDGSFLLYRPAVAVVTNVEADHLDHYGTAEAVDEAFRAFARRIEPGGFLVACADDPGSARLAAAAAAEGVRVRTYGESDGADVQVRGLAVAGDGSRFSAVVDGREAITEAYRTGRGSFRVRARWAKEDLGRGTWAAVVNEIPYGVPKSRLIEKIAELVGERKLPLLADVRDESAEDVRIVLEPRSRSVDPVMMMESLFRLTELEARVPIVSATAETLRARLEPLVASASERRRIGAESRAYVEQVHDLERVADRLLALYARL